MSQPYLAGLFELVETMECTKDGLAIHMAENNKVLSEAEHSKNGLNLDKNGSHGTCDTGRKEIAKETLSENDRLPSKPQQKSSRKENFCLSNYAEGNMNRSKQHGKTFDNMPTTSSRKFPPFRTGKYVPKDDVYSFNGKSEKAILHLTASKSKSPSSKDVLAMSCPLPFRVGKMSPSDLHVSADSSDRAITSPRSVKKKDKLGSPGYVQRTRSPVDGKQGRYSPDFHSHRGNRNRLPFDTEKCSSLERIGQSKLPSVNALKAINQISMSNNAVDSRSVNSQSCNSALETLTRNKTRSENVLTVRSPHQRPKSSVLELSSKSSTGRKSAKDMLTPSDKSKLVATRHQQRPRSTNLELSNKIPCKVVSSTAGGFQRPRSYVVQTLAVGDSESRKYLRKSSDTSSRVYQRPKSVVLNTSNSDRSSDSVRPRKARRVPKRNVYVKKQKPRVQKKISSKSKSEQCKSKETRKTSESVTDGRSRLTEAPSEMVKPCFYDIFMDKFCVKVKCCGKQFKIPVLKRCRLMVWKIKRISYIFYEKVLFFFL